MMSIDPSNTTNQVDNKIIPNGPINWSYNESLSVGHMELEVSQKKPKIDVQSACRLCAQKVINPFYIYSDLGESLKLEQKINNWLTVKVDKTDPLPKQLCSTCVDKVMWSHEFNTQCQQAEKTLSTILFEQQNLNTSEILNIDTNCDKSCPLCLEGSMSIIPSPNGNETNNESLFESNTEKEPTTVDEMVQCDNMQEDPVVLQYFEDSQQYLKCNACMNLFNTKEMLDSHKCKPSLRNTSKPYTCSICDVKFDFEEQLNFHLQFHNGNKSLCCEICKISFCNELKLFYHYKRYHCNEKIVSCLQCGKLLDDQEKLKLHVCVDGKTRSHVCEVCNKGFTDNYTLKRHVVTHLPEKPYKCSECPKSFTQKSRLNKHIAEHSVSVDLVQAVWNCLECGEIFKNFEDSENHCKIHDSDSKTTFKELHVSKLLHCEFCNSYFIDDEKLKIHQNLHTVEKPYSCNSCNAVYKSFAEAVIHWKEHVTSFKVDITFVCDICNKDMKELSFLYKHKQKCHERIPRRSETGVLKFACELCGKLFDEIGEFNNHEREKCSKFPCDICGSLLPSVNSLNAHKRRHIGLRPYVCNICGKSYTQSSHMWTHIRFHMGIKPYACEYCDQRFSIKPDLSDHVRKKHTRERPFKCDVCGKAFLTGSVFYQHRLIHRGERRYKCYICDKTFTRAEALNNHVKIHTGEKPHMCNFCGKCFRQKGDMRKHCKSQHSELNEN